MLSLFFNVFLLFFAFIPNAYAYLDPGTSSLLLSSIVALFASFVYALKSFFYKITWGGFSFFKKSSIRHGIVIYGEDKRYFSVFEPVIQHLEKCQCPYLYYTHDENDPVLTYPTQFGKVECIGKNQKAWAKLNSLVADVCLMSTPQLDVLQIKRSPGVKHYAHILHSAGIDPYEIFALDYFDSVLINSPVHTEFIREVENARQLKPKQIEIVGCTYLDFLQQKLNRLKNEEHSTVKPLFFSNNNKPTVLLAPSWGRNALFAKYGMRLLNPLIQTEYNIIIRPHPQTYISQKELLEELKKETKNYSNVQWDDRVDNIHSMKESDILLGDFSGVLFDYVALFNKPLITLELEFNPIGYDLEDSTRKKPWLKSQIEAIGKVLKEEDFSQIKTIIDEALNDIQKAKERENLKNLLWQYPNQSGEKTAEALINIQKKVLEENPKTIPPENKIIAQNKEEKPLVAPRPFFPFPRFLKGLLCAWTALFCIFSFNVLWNANQVYKAEIRTIQPQWGGKKNEVIYPQGFRFFLHHFSSGKIELKKGKSGTVDLTVNVSATFNDVFFYYLFGLSLFLSFYSIFFFIQKYQAVYTSLFPLYQKMIYYSTFNIHFLICFFIPFTLYQSDIHQFDPTQTPLLLITLAGVFLLLSLLSLYILSFIPKKYASLPAVILPFVLSLGMLNLFVFTGDYGAMDHFVLQKDPPTNFSESDYLKWIISAILSFFIILFSLKKILPILKILLLTFLLVTCFHIFSIFNQQAEEEKQKQSLNNPLSVKAPLEDELFSYSKKDKNIVVFVLDQFTGSHMPEMLKQFPELKTKLDGFILFDNAISSSNSTVHSIGTLMGGEYYTTYNMNQRQDELAKSIDQAFINTTDAFLNNGFKVSLITQTATNEAQNIQRNKPKDQLFVMDIFQDSFFTNYFVRKENLVLKKENQENNTILNKETADLLQFALFKLAMEFQRASIYNDGFWLFQKDLRSTYGIQKAAGIYAATHILNTDSPKPTFKYFHTVFTHAPFQGYFNKNTCDFSSNKTVLKEYPHTAYNHKMEKGMRFYQHYDIELCALSYIGDYIESLKERGIYHNTQIFIVSDHSANDNFNIPIASEKNFDSYQSARPDVLFLFKDFNQSGILKTDSRLMANFDMPTLFCANLKEGCPRVSPSILKNYPENRSLIHTVPSDFSIHAHEKNRWLIDYAYSLNGNRHNLNDWKDISAEIANTGKFKKPR